MIRRFIAAGAIACALPFAGAAAALAEATPSPPTECSDPGYTCDYDGTQWNVTAPATDQFGNPGDDGSGPNVAGIFGVFVVIALVVGGATFFWRINTARRIAQQAGLDPDAAATTAMLSNDGLAATYLAASLQQRRPDEDDEPVVHPPPLSTRTNENRLGELKRLHDQGLITDDEYARRRTAIVDSL